jgi:hypothetical protein
LDFANKTFKSEDPAVLVPVKKNQLSSSYAKLASVVASQVDREFNRAKRKSSESKASKNKISTT